MSCSDVLIFCKYRAVLALLHAHFTDFKQNFHVMLHVGKKSHASWIKIGKVKGEKCFRKEDAPRQVTPSESAVEVDDYQSDLSSLRY